MVNKYKVVIVGTGGVGKTCLTIQFCHNQFQTEYDPTIENLYRKQVSISGSICVLEILDTAGQEEFSGMRDQNFRAGQGFFLVYSIDNRRSFQQIDTFYEAIANVKDTTIFPRILVGNKLDMDHKRAVTTDEGIALASQLKCPHFETSAKTRENVDEIFLEMIKELKRYQDMRKSNSDQNLETKKPKESSCCVLL